MTDARDTLIQRYLAGTADDDEIRRLDAMLTRDPDARRALVLAAATDAHLRECLADEAETESGAPAPALTAARAESEASLSPRVSSPRRRLRIGWLSSAAAAVLLMAGVGFWLGRYPEPKASGAYRVVGGGPVRRGAVLQAEDGHARLELGGYCHVDLDPNSIAKIAGDKRAEEVVLRRGRAVCRADRGEGAFVVRTDVGTVSVTGTHFAVKLIEDQGDDDMFDRRMAVRVLAGTVLVSGTWGEMTVRAGESATVPTPESVVRKVVAGLELGEAQTAKLDAALSTTRVRAFRAGYRTEVRAKLFQVAHTTLSRTMPKIMPKKVAPKVQAIRRKLRAGPPNGRDMARIRSAMQKRTRKIMMPTIHKIADDLADQAAADDHLIAWLLSRKVRAALGGEKVAAFDKAAAAAGIAECESAYFAQAKKRVHAAMEAYDPDLTGIVDMKTGAVIAKEADTNLPERDKALTGTVAAKLRPLIGPLQLPKAKASALEAMLTDEAIEGRRATYCMAVRKRLFAAARTKQQAELPKQMPPKVQAKVQAIRMRLKVGDPPPKEDIARIQQAVMKRTRPLMADNLHRSADVVAKAAACDEGLVAAAVAAAMEAKVPADKRSAFQAAVTQAGISADESAYIAQVEQRIATVIKTYDPDITGLVDPKTGKITAGED